MGTHQSAGDRARDVPASRLGTLGKRRMAYFSPMPGTKATRPAGGHDPIAPEDAAPSVEAQHWRDLATTREATLRSLTRRPVVRLALGVDRRLAPVSRRCRAWWIALRGVGDRATLSVGALTARPRPDPTPGGAGSGGRSPRTHPHAARRSP